MGVKPENDAYGQENLAHLLGRESFEVVERDDGFVGLSGGPRTYFSKYRAWPLIEKKAIKFAKGRILDVGCGAGRVSLFLQQKGFDATGIDNSPTAVEVSKRRGLKKAMALPIEDIGTFKPDSFDTIIMFGNNFGLFGSHQKAKRLLKRMHNITSKDAVILAESLDPYNTKDPVHLAYHKLNRERGRMGGQLRIRIRFRNFVGSWFDYLLVSRSELKEVLRGTGWRVKKFMGSRRPLYIAVIEKETLPRP